MKKLFSLLAAALLTCSLYAGEITVADGTTTNDNLPVYGFYADTGFSTQFIYPASSLANIDGSNITAIQFFSAKSSVAFPNGEVTVKLAEVEQTTLSALMNDASFQKVYQGSFDVVDGLLVFTFSEPYAYNGGNLLVQVALTKLSTVYPATSFYGLASTGSGFLRYKSGSTNMDYGRDFLPKAAISFAEAVGTCPRPSKLTCAATPDGGIFTWQAEAGAQHQYCVVAKDAEPAGWTLLNADVFNYTAKGLTAGTTYDFYIRTYCSESEQSAESKLSFTPECKAPASITLSDLTHNSAILSWDEVAGIDKYQYICLEKGETPEWEGVEAKAGLSAVLTNLEPSTSYDFYVRSWFNAETQSAATKLTFTTNCEAKTLPFREYFTETTLPDCWTAANWGTSYNYWSIDTYTAHRSGTYSLKYNARTSSSSDITTASIELSEAAIFGFYYQNRYGSSGSAINFDVIVLDASNEAELLKESITTASPSGENEWTEKTIDLTAHTGKIIKIKFVGKGTGGSTSCYLRIDEVTVKAKPCDKPTDLKADASSTGAVVTWQAANGENEWNLRHKSKSATEWTTVEALTKATYTIIGLAAGAEYEVQVQAVCNEDKQSSWTSSVKFTPVCPVPAVTAVSLITDNAATVAWESTESKFNLQYREAEAAEWTAIQNIAAKTCQLKDLKASTTYEVQVQAACGGEFSDVFTFTTKCAPLANAIPFSENFETVVTRLPECWEFRSETAYPLVEETSAAHGADSDNKSNCIIFRGSNEQLLILPPFDENYCEWSLYLFYKAVTSSLELGYLTSLYGEFQTLATLPAATEYATQATQIELKNAPATAKYLAIRYTSSSEFGYSAVDDLSIDQPKEVTAVINTNAANKSAKSIENGQLIITLDGVRYNAQGQKL